jgi:DnaK suppressor protein
MDNTHFRKLIDREVRELKASSNGSRGLWAPVKLYQQSVGRLSRMNAMQQQSM